MNEIAETSETDRYNDPREVLDGVKRAKIVAMLEMGCSRRVAARHVGCAPSTITRTAQRDPEFAAQLGDAENQAEVEALKVIRRTMQEERYWRVAAWVLERRDPEEYGRRAPFTFRGGDVIALLQRMMELVLPAIAANKAAEICETFYDLLEDVAEKANLPPPERELHWADEAIQDVKGDSPIFADTKIGTVPEAPPQIATKTPPRQDHRPVPSADPSHTSHARPANGRPTKSGPVNRKNGHAPRLLDELLPPQPRPSCLEQFVQRSGKPKLQPAGA